MLRDGSSESSCLLAARHGPNQRVVSYSLFQMNAWTDMDKTDAWETMLMALDQNAELSDRLYPRWRVRVYHDTVSGTERRSRLARVACRHSNIDLCYVLGSGGDESGAHHGAMWRFLPLGDPLVRVFVSRDLDSRPSQREAAAVAAWLDASETFHVMRDHWDHAITMPGGLWGAKVAQKRPLMKQLNAKLAWWFDTMGHKNWDQRALHAVVWHYASADSVQHDSYTCQQFPGNTVPFPTQRAENDTTLYVGQVVTGAGGGGDEKPRPCPAACRPQKHRDWEYC